MLRSCQIIFYSCCLLCGILLMIHTINTIRGEDMLYPQILLSGWIVCAGWCTYDALRPSSRPSAEGNWRAFWLALAATATFILLLVPAGFIPAACCFFVGYAMVLGYRSWWVLPIAAVVTAAFYAVFELFLQIPLPKGYFFS